MCSMLERFRRERHPKRETHPTGLEPFVIQAAQGQQQVLRTYEAGTPSIVDLKKERPGAIFRLDGKKTDIPDMHIYSWYIIGHPEGEMPNVYYIHHGSPHEMRFNYGERLRLGESWELNKLQLNGTEFSAETARKILHTNEVVPQLNRLVPVVKIDFIESGMRKREKVIAPPPLGKLVPLPVQLL